MISYVKMYGNGYMGRSALVWNEKRFALFTLCTYLHGFRVYLSVRVRGVYRSWIAAGGRGCVGILDEEEVTMSFS